MTTTEIIALAGFFVTLLAFIVKSLRDSHGDVSGNAARDARFEAKLDNIDTGVNDMRVEVRTMREKQTEQAEKLAVLESSIKSAHHRIDRMENAKGE